jgi:hypothetical protein
LLFTLPVFVVFLILFQVLSPTFEIILKIVFLLRPHAPHTERSPLPPCS